MTRKTQAMLRTVEKTVRKLIEQCGKNGQLYQENPRKVAHVSRTGKWLLNAMAALKNDAGDERQEDQEDEMDG